MRVESDEVGPGHQLLRTNHGRLGILGLGGEGLDYPDEGDGGAGEGSGDVADSTGVAEEEGKSVEV